SQLISKGLWGAVTGDSVDPAVDQKAHALIVLHVSDHHLMTVGSCSSTKEAWDTLKNTYEAKTTARKLILRRELTQLKMGAAEPLTLYAARAKDIQAQLRTAGERVEDQEVAIHFLAGLPSAFDMIVTVITAGSAAELSIDSMLPKLLPVEQKAQPERADRFSEAALAAKPRYRFGSGAPKVRKEERECFYCHEKGHIVPDCPKKKRDLAAARKASKGYRQHGAIALTARSAAEQPPSGSHQMRWVLDTGASRHMTSDSSILSSIRPLESSITITFGNGGTGTATAVGE
ncbi:hypothetical protein ABPG75_005183, partial [Micractinium tetrahymenae]